MSYVIEKTYAVEVLKRLAEEMRHKRTIKTALPAIVQAMMDSGRSISPSDYKKFTHQIGPRKWQGIIYRSRNTMMGTIFSYFGNKVLIVRGYPKIKYSEASRVLNQKAYAENKYDGTNLGIWMMPNGDLMGKTREVEWWTGQGYKGRKWDILFKQTGHYDALMKITKDDYQVFGELYGSENPGDFVRYTTPINFRAFDIVDRRTFSFLPYRKKVKLMEDYGLEYVGLYWKGQLTMKEVEKIEFQIKDLVKEDGFEGMVAKWYDTEVKDTFFAKLKCMEIREKSWSLSPRSGVPRGLIAKAVRKAYEANIKDMDEILAFVKEELIEEAEPALVEKAGDEIKRMVYKLAQPIQDFGEIQVYIKELEDSGIKITIENTNKVMNLLGTKFFGQNPGKLYNAFMTYVTKDGKKDE